MDWIENRKEEKSNIFKYYPNAKLLYQLQLIIFQEDQLIILKIIKYQIMLGAMIIIIY